MAIAGLTTAQNRNQFFHRTVLNNLRYWQGWAEESLADLTNLDREQDGIVRALRFALDIEVSWETVYPFIIKLSPLYARRGYWDPWQGILERAMGTARRLGDGQNEANLSALLGLLLQQQSRFNEAVVRHRRTIRLARQVNNSFAQARACTNLGFLYTDRGQWYRAEILCCHALKLFEQIGSDFGCAHTENHLGLVHMHQNRWEQAQHHFERACQLWQLIGDDHGLMRGFTNLSALFIWMEQADKALDYLEKALQKAELIGEKVVVGTIYQNKGKVYKLKGDLLNAEINLLQAEKIFRNYSEMRGLARLWNNLGSLYILQKKWTEADFYLEKSLATCENLESRVEMVFTLFSLVDYDLGRGNKERAIGRLEKIQTLIGTESEKSLYKQFQLQLNEYRRNLME